MTGSLFTSEVLQSAAERTGIQDVVGSDDLTPAGGDQVV